MQIIIRITFSQIHPKNEKNDKKDMVFKNKKRDK